MKNQAISIKYGVGIGILLMASFLLLSIFNLHIKPYYSVVNLVIVGLGIFSAIKIYKKQHQQDMLKSFNYQKGFRVGVVAGFLATIIFSIFFLIYTSYIDPEFIGEMLADWDAGYDVGAGTVTFIVFLMGLATTVVVSLAIMQIMKDSWNTKQGKRYTISNNEKDNK